MNGRNRQIILEIFAYTAEGVILISYLLNQSLHFLAYLLVAQFLISIGNTIGWLTWVHGSENKAKLALTVATGGEEL